MELKDFISQTLVSIVDGVGAAQDYAKEHGARINPDVRNIHAPGIITDPNHVYMQVVDFDVAVSVSDTDAVRGDLKAGVNIGLGSIQVVGIGSEVRGSKIKDNVSVSRIKFSIPVRLPMQ
jgi:hypothetical protein